MITIVDTGVANRYSVRNALEYLGCNVRISAQRADIESASHLVFPGVGAFAAGMESLRGKGLVEMLTREVIEKGKPILGICLGFQMMAESSSEGGANAGLGWVPGKVIRIASANPALKVPHIGFNTIHARPGSRLFAGLEAADFYFVHSYHLITDDTWCAASVEYGEPLCAAIERGNIWGTQFHPEKSQSAGLKLLRNFVAIS